MIAVPTPCAPDQFRRRVGGTLRSRPRPRVQTAGAVVAHREILVFTQPEAVLSPGRPIEFVPTLGLSEQVLDVAGLADRQRPAGKTGIVIVAVRAELRRDVILVTLHRDPFDPDRPVGGDADRRSVQRMIFPDERPVLGPVPPTQRIERRRLLESDDLPIDPQRHRVVVIAEADLMTPAGEDPHVSRRHPGVERQLAVVVHAVQHPQRHGSRSRFQHGLVFDAGLHQFDHEGAGIIIDRDVGGDHQVAHPMHPLAVVVDAVHVVEIETGERPELRKIAS